MRRPRPQPLTWIVSISLAAAGGVMIWQSVHRRPADRVYKIGWDADPPFQAAGADGRPTGLAVELVREAARRRGIRLEWVHYQHGGADSALRDQKVDLWPLLSIMPERKNRVHISQPYLETEHCFLVRSESGVAEIHSLANALISYHDLPINRWDIGLALPSARLLPTPGTNAALESVCKRRADAAFVDEYTAVSAILAGLSCSDRELSLIPIPEIRTRMGVGSTFAASAAADAIRDEIGNMAGEVTLPPALLHWSYFSRRHMEAIQALREANRRQQLLMGLVGVLLGVIVLAGWLTYRTLSERRRAVSAEKALGTTQRNYQLLTEQAADGVFLADSKGRFLLANFQMCEMLGYSNEEMLRLSVPDTYFPDERETARRHLAGIPCGASVRFERRMRRKDGTAMTVEESVVKLANGSSQGIVRDVTDRKRIEAALRESEERFRNLADSAPVMIWVAGPDRVLNFFNKTWLDFVGRTLKQELSNGWIENLHPDDVERFSASYSSAFDARKSFRTECRLRRADGEYRWALCTGVPRVGPDGVFAGYIGSDIDITDMRRAQEEAQALQKLESLGVLAGGIAHDFNNLLGSILTNCELVLSDLPGSSPAYSEVQAIQSVADRAAEIVRQMMAYAGQESPVLETVDVSGLVSDMLQLLKVSISKSAVLRVDLPASLPVVRANAAQIRQVVMNLITNASEAIGQKAGLITVAVSKQRLNSAEHKEGMPDLSPGDYVRLEVTDTGCGMTEEIRARIFDPFFTTKFAGRGLGLASVQGIVRSHGGAIRVESSPGRGSRFEVLLPCSEPTQEFVNRTAPAVIGQTASCSGTVLFVEDEDSLRIAVSTMLRRKGFRVIEADNGRTAVDLFRVNHGEVDLVFLDMTLPNLSGREVLQELRQIEPEVMVVVTSAYSQEHALATVAEPRPRHFIRKPYQISDLVALLSKVSLRDEPMTFHAVD
jgi:two-component system, cell cycle sensor histidine kinase and response regulator CckA